MAWCSLSDSNTQELWSALQSLEAETQRQKARIAELEARNASLEGTNRGLLARTEEAEKIVERMPMGAVVLGPTGLIQSYNGEAAGLLSLIPEDVNQGLGSLDGRVDSVSALIGVVQGRTSEAEIVASEGRRFIARCQPLVGEEAASGSLLTLIELETSLDRQEAAGLRTIFDALLEQSPMGIAVVDEELRYTHVSSRADELLGYSPSELLGKTASEVIAGQGPVIDSWRREVLRTGKSNTREFVSPAEHVMAVTHFLIEGDDGSRSVGLFGVDITELHEAKRREQEAENDRILTTVFEESPVVLVLIDHEGRILRANSAAKLHGVREGDSALELLPEAYDWFGGEPEVLCDGSGVLLSLLSGEVETWEGELAWDRGGSSGRLSASLRSLDANGLKTVLLSARDLTALELTQRTLDEERAVMDAAVEASFSFFIVVDVEGKIALMNEIAREVTGMKPGMARTAWSGIRVLHDDGREYRPDEMFFPRVMRNETIRGETLSIEFEDGRPTRSYAVRSKAITLDGEALGVIIEGNDVTDLLKARRRAEARQAELEAARQVLTKRNAMLEEFSSVISHDLQEPLRTILNHSKLLERELEGSDHEALKVLGFMTSAASRSQQMVRDLLEYSRAGQDSPAGVCSPGEVLRSVLDQLAGSISETGARIEVGEMPERVSIDGSLLGRVLQNLLSNSLRFQVGQPNIDLFCSVEGGLATFSVQDDGIGVPSHQLDVVFEPFRRLHSQTEFPGSGVGLPICRSILEALGGEIHLEPCATGTHVVFSVPVHQSPEV